MKTKEELKGEICCKGCYKLGFQEGRKQTLEEVEKMIDELEVESEWYEDYCEDGDHTHKGTFLKQLIYKNELKSKIKSLGEGK